MSEKDKNVVEFIPADQADSTESVELETVYTVEDWDSTMSDLAEGRAKTLRVPRAAGSPSRSAVVSAFTNAFELIGGVPRLALWANDNPTKFYQLYAKLLPAGSGSPSLGESRDLVIRHILPRGALDE